jgi:diguanylate cyclase (GGDEF)-like protein
MTLVNGLPALLMLVTAVISALIGWFIYSRRTQAGAIYLVLMMAAVSLYSFTYASELLSLSIPAKMVWIKLSYLGVLSLAPLWLLFTLTYSRNERWVTRRRVAFLWALPLLTMILVFTNEFHHLVWTSIVPISPQPGASLGLSHGIAYWVYVVYAYTLLLAGSILLLRATWRKPQKYRRQALIILMVVSLPWLGNLVYILGLSPWPGFDPTSIAFGLSGVLIAWALFRLRILNLLPVARDVLFEKIQDGVIVVDDQDRILDLNPAARQWLNVREDVIGRSILEVIGAIPGMPKIHSLDQLQTQIRVGAENNQRVFSLAISPLGEPQPDTGANTAQVILIHEITQEIKLLETAQQRSDQLMALQTVSRTVASSLELPEIMETVVRLLHDTFGYGLVSIYLLEQDTLQLGAQVGYPLDEIYRVMPISQGILGRTVRNKQTYFVRDVSSDPDFLRVAAEISAEICTPLMKEGEVLGVLNVESTPKRSLSEDDVNLLITFGNQVAVAIDNARLFRQEQSQRQVAEVLFAATRDFTAGLSEEGVLKAIVDHLEHALGVIGCTISRWDPVGDCVITLIDHTIKQAAVAEAPGRTYHLADYPSTRFVLENRTPLYLSLADPVIEPGEKAILERDQHETVLILPLMTSPSGQVFGIVELYGNLGDEFITGERLALTQSLLAQAAGAIENARLYARVRRLSILDELTGLHNRRGLFETGRREFDRAERFHRPLSLLFLDLDHFKQFNDQFSYAVGDQALRLLASCLLANLREIDLAGRYGGEEFVVILPETELAAAIQVAERLRRAVEAARLKTDQGELGFTISIGVCAKTPDLPDMEALVERAGLALHAAKQGGRNRVSVAA